MVSLAAGCVEVGANVEGGSIGFLHQSVHLVMSAVSGIPSWSYQYLAGPNRQVLQGEESVALSEDLFLPVPFI